MKRNPWKLVALASTGALVAAVAMGQASKPPAPAAHGKCVGIVIRNDAGLDGATIFRAFEDGYVDYGRAEYGWTAFRR